MAKKDRERLHQRLQDDVARMTPANLTREEVIAALREAGADPDQLRARLHQRARDLANAQRAKGKPAPEYLQQVVDLTGPPEALPKDAKHALAKATFWIKGLTQPPPGIPNVQIARAYRKKGELTKKDEDLLDALEADLRREANDK
jgi:hypothetical protein